MAGYNGNNTSGNAFSLFRQEDGKVLGRIREGIKPAFPSAGNQDYRFFVEPLSPLPKGYEEAERVGFTGFMSRIGYDCSFFASDEEAWNVLKRDWAGGLVSFTPALRNNKYFVLDDLQKEDMPLVLDGSIPFVPVPLFHAEEDPTFDGDINKVCRHIGEGKPLPGLSRKYWDHRVLPQAIAVSFQLEDGSPHFVLLAPLLENAFREIVISEGGAYFYTHGPRDLGYCLVDFSQPELGSRVVLCHGMPLCFVPQDLLAKVKETMLPVPEDYGILGPVAQSPAKAADTKDSVPTAAPASRKTSVKAFVGRVAEKEEKETAVSRVAVRQKNAEKSVVPPIKVVTKEISAEGTSRAVSEAALGKTVPISEKKAYVEKKKEELTEKAFLERLSGMARTKGLLYDKKDLINFHISVKSSRLVILAGMSGTGKSGLVRLYGEALGLPEEQIALIPVRPSWMDDGDILGYVDMKNMIYRPADTGLAELLREADRHRERLYIVCFDEMNLARAEHYFAQFISVLEKDGDEPMIRLYNPAMERRIYNSSDYPAEIPVGPNVIFTGTVNVDESAYHFSDKILDRANVITLSQGKFRGLRSLRRGDAKSGKEITAWEWEKFRVKHDRVALTDEELDFLDTLNDVMRSKGMTGGIGFRTALQMDNYLANIPAGVAFTRADGLDSQTVQRILTKIRGSSEQLKDLLSLDENGNLAGAAAEVFAQYNRLSPFAEARKVLERKAEELKIYDYTM